MSEGTVEITEKELQPAKQEKQPPAELLPEEEFAEITHDEAAEAAVIAEAEQAALNIQNLEQQIQTIKNDPVTADDPIALKAVHDLENQLYTAQVHQHDVEVELASVRMRLLAYLDTMKAFCLRQAKEYGKAILSVPGYIRWERSWKKQVYTFAQQANEKSGLTGEELASANKKANKEIYGWGSTLNKAEQVRIQSGITIYGSYDKFKEAESKAMATAAKKK